MSDAAPSPGDDERLLAFLRDRDQPCPLCGYNLRDLTTPVCPECRQILKLTVGADDLRFGWLLVTIAPGIFSGIAAGFLLFPLIAQPLFGGGWAPLTIMLVDAFGWISGLSALLLARKRLRFLRLERSVQMVLAIAVWVVHVLALAGFITGAWLL